MSLRSQGGLAMKLMYFVSSLLLTAATLAPLSAQAAGEVKVNFAAPEKFTDIGMGSVDRERVLRSLGEFLTSLGERGLPDGQTLELEVTNIDLAGETRFTPKGDLRVIRGRADWPQIELRYTLRAGEKVLKSGEAKISDVAYTSGRSTPDLKTEFGYEKRMLRSWFTETFAKP